MNIITKIRLWLLKKVNFDAWWKEYSIIQYCNNCKYNNGNCSIDYYSGKCYNN